MIAYVFVENDVGDNIKDIKRDSNMPYTVYRNNAVSIDSAFVAENKFRTKWHYRLQYYLCARSLLVSTVKSRLQLLRDHGSKQLLQKQIGS